MKLGTTEAAGVVIVVIVVLLSSTKVHRFRVWKPFTSFDNRFWWDKVVLSCVFSLPLLVLNMLRDLL